MLFTDLELNLHRGRTPVLRVLRWNSATVLPGPGPTTGWQVRETTSPEGRRSRSGEGRTSFRCLFARGVRTLMTALLIATTARSRDRESDGMSWSAGSDVKDQLTVFSDGTSPLFRQAPHIVDQGRQSILVHSYPLFFQTALETGRTEALVCFHIVQNLPAVFKPDDLVVRVFMLIARRSCSGGQDRGTAPSTSPAQCSRTSEHSIFLSLPESFGSWPDHLPSLACR
jgi:hypothetical protein